ncbi:hypothetical protein HY622_00720 [Candidatus Uhrbacteria bacterium]|nr:hypothetical protein [Candidatus Uhrbacteria bacterium]
MQKIIIGFVVCALVAGSAGVYGGMLYVKSKQSAASDAFSEGRAQFFRGAGMSGQGVQGSRNGLRRAAGAFAAGDIIAKDDTSITLKLQDGGSKIILLSPSLSVSTFTAGTSSDLTVGTPVMVTGEGNPDGSMTAQSIQVRPVSESQRLPSRTRGD